MVHGVSVFIDSLIRDLSISRTEISAVFSLASLGGALTLPMIGSQIDAHGLRQTVLVIAVAFGAAIVALSQVQGIVALAIGFYGIRMLGQGALNLTSKVAIALRFDAAPGRAVGLSGALGSLSIATLAVILSACVEAFGWRAVWLGAGVAIWLIVIPLTLWAFQPAGDRALSAVAERSSTGGVDQWSRAHAIRTAVFWLITFAVASNSLIVTGLMFHQISVLGEAGLAPTRAAANLLPQTAASAIAMMTIGSIAHRLPRKVLLLFPMGCLALGMMVVSVLDDGWMSIIYAILLGTASGTAYTAEGVLTPRYFGVKAIASIRSLTFTFNVAGAAIGPVVLGILYDGTGSYAISTQLMLVVPAAIALGTLLVRTPVHPGPFAEEDATVA